MATPQSHVGIKIYLEKVGFQIKFANVKKKNGGKKLGFKTLCSEKWTPMPFPMSCVSGQKKKGRGW